MTTPQFKQLRRSYGFDEVAIVPGDVTVNPNQANTDFTIEGITFSIPILASAMDGVTDVICLNPSHGERKERYDYSSITKRDLDFVRRAIIT